MLLLLKVVNKRRTKSPAARCTFKIADGLHATKRNVVQHIDVKSDENTVTIKLLCTKTFLPEQYQAEKQKKHLEKVVKKILFLNLLSFRITLDRLEYSV